MSEYSELLKDPRWQKKRLEIFNRDGFECQLCFGKEHTLHVHHLSYRKGALPWEYNNDNFKTLCEFCHGLITWTTKYGTPYKNINSIKHFPVPDNRRLFFVWVHNYKELEIVLKAPEQYGSVGMLDNDEAEKAADFMFLPTYWREAERCFELGGDDKLLTKENN